jgi:hypothetical protein
MTGSPRREPTGRRADGWIEPDASALAELTQTGLLAADSAAATAGADIPADRDRKVIRAALRGLLANGIITPTARELWPEWVQLDPPEDGGIAGVRSETGGPPWREWPHAGSGDDS